MSEFIIIQDLTPAQVIEVSAEGPQGPSGTVEIGSVTTGAAGSQADVTNSGTSTNAVLDFVIPKGDTGDITPELLAAKDAAIASANAASSSASTASTQATAAGASASAASISATNATNSATASANSATASAASASTATTQATNASASASASAASATSAAGSATTATTQASNASTSATNAANSATAASNSAAASSNSATAAASSATTASTQATAAGVSATTATTQATNAANSATASAASATSSANSATIATTQAANASTSATNAANSAAAASTSATTASTQAANASTSATTASNQASIATASATAASASATTVANLATNLDLTGVNATALHRSPNAVTAMFVYDTSKDSDGGAWTEKCQHTSWYNEALNGKWLGARISEVDARNQNAILSATEIVTNGTFDSTTTGWTQAANTTIASVSGELLVTNIGTNSGTASQAFSTVVGKVYRVTATARIGTATAAYVIARTSPTSGNIAVGDVYSTANTTVTFYFAATGTTTHIATVNNNTSGGTAYYDNISVREATALTTASGDYYQSTVDGKFYKLNPTSGVTETFRGNKADFPRLAGIVAEAESLSVYDLTEPGRPMFMRFRGGSVTTGVFFTQSAGINSLAALNGVLAVGQPTLGLRLIDFSKDRVFGHRGTGNNTFTGLFNGGISLRNSATVVYDGLAPSQTIVNASVNAVAMTVLPDAPVDVVSGLQVPTIAVGTNGGVSVIKHNGTVVNSSSTSAMTAVTLSPQLLSVSLSGASAWFYNANPVGLTASFSLTAPNQSAVSGLHLPVAMVGLKNAGRGAYGRTSTGLIGFIRQNESNVAGSSSRTITNTYNTGHLIGDIRRAYLADVDVGSVPAPNLIINGDFSSSTLSNWGLQDGNMTISIEAGSLRVYKKPIGTSTYTYYNLTTSPGIKYTVTADFLIGTAVSVKYDIRDGWYGGSTILIQSAAFSVDSTQSVTFTALSNSTSIRFVNNSGINDTYFYVDNVVAIQIAVPDRSYKAAQASITGTLTKTQVALAAQTVAYSGFSAANYLREPYSADLDFGTGEWSASAWVNVPVTLPAASFPVIGLELNDDTGFDTAGNWTVAAGWSVASGDAVATNANGTTVGRTRSFTVGKTYAITFTVTGYTSGQIQGIIGSVVSSTVAAANGTFTVFVTAAAASTQYGLRANGSTNATVTFLSVKEALPAIIADRSHTSGAYLNLGVTGTGRLEATAFDGTTTRTVTTSAAYNTATWIKPEAVYTTDGTLAIRVNGAEVAATRGTPLLSLTTGRNLLSYSQDFDNAAWQKSNVAVVANIATAPDGTTSADSLVATGTGSARVRQSATVQSGVSITVSVFAKENTKGFLFIQNSAVTNSGTWFNLTAGTVGTKGAGDTATITSLSDGWYRCIITGTSASTTATCDFYIAGADGSLTVASADSIYLRGAQLDQAASATDYFATNVAPLTIGNSYAADAPFPGSISLLKLSATVPTAEQSQWMYEQEKQMFRDGAQVCLPDSGSIVDLTYDDATDKWIAVSATNESEWSGLVRTSVTPSPAGSYSKVTATSGIQLQARTTTNPGVDITIPTYAIREELVNRSQAAAKLSRSLVSFDYVGGFTANTTSGSTAIVSVAGITYPVSYIGARVSATGIAADTFVAAVSGTTIYLTKPATATATGVQISFNDFILPVGYEAKAVLLAGVSQREGTTQAFTRLFDGFKETIRFTTAPSNTAFVQIQATRSI